MNVNHRSGGMIVAALYLSAVLLASCGGGGGGGGSSPNTGPGPSGKVKLSGTVSAPGGILAFNAPTSWKRFWANIFSREAVAASSGLSPVGSGVAVSLIQIDNTAAQVGAAIASTTTDASGNYQIEAPPGFTPTCNYVLLASSSTVSMRSCVTGTIVDVNPTMEAIMQLAAEKAAALKDASVTALTGEVIAAVVQSIGAAEVFSTPSVTQWVDAVKQTVTNSADLNAVVDSMVRPAGITGTVKDSNGAPLAGIKIEARLFKEQQLQSISRTDTQGKYTVRMPAGDYILAAINDMPTSPAASAWWKTGGGTPSVWSAEKITVGSLLVTRDFTLQAGGRISGIVTSATTSDPLLGINIMLRDFNDSVYLMTVPTQEDGSFHMNVAPGDYYIAARNQTLLPYATQMYNSTLGSGGQNKTQAEKITITTGATKTANMSLAAGTALTGVVTDSGTNPVKGIAVRVTDANDIFVEAVRTGNDGKYRIWLQSAPSATYKVRSYGQDATVNMSSSQTLTFNAAVQKVIGVLKDGSGNPVTQALVYDYDGTLDPAMSVFTWEASRGDGSFEIYSQQSHTGRMAIKIDNNQLVGSMIYAAASSTVPLLAGDVLAPAGLTTDLGIITLPAGGVLKGKVTNLVGGAPRAGVFIQVRTGGIANANRSVGTRSMSDGSYSISLPAGATFARICAGTGCPNIVTTNPGATYHYQDGILITAPTTTLNFAF